MRWGRSSLCTGLRCYSGSPIKRSRWIVGLVKTRCGHWGMCQFCSSSTGTPPSTCSGKNTLRRLGSLQQSLLLWPSKLKAVAIPKARILYSFCVNFETWEICARLSLRLPFDTRSEDCHVCVRMKRFPCVHNIWLGAGSSQSRLMSYILLQAPARTGRHLLAPAPQPAPATVSIQILSYPLLKEHYPNPFTFSDWPVYSHRLDQ